MLLDNYVKVKINSANKNYYENKGYEIPTKINKNGKRHLLRCTNHFANPDECKLNHSIFYDELINKVQKDLEMHLQHIGSTERPVIPMTRSTVIQWIDYIEVGHAETDDEGTSRNQVVVHYIEPAKEKQKWRNRKRGGFYGW